MTYYFAKTLDIPFDAAVDPVSSMQAVNNPNLADMAATVQAKLASVINSLREK